MATAQDLIDASLREIGVLAAGETPSYNDSADALEQLNRLLDQWQAERLRIFTITRTTWAVVSGTGQYTFGTGGTGSASRPAIVNSMGFIDTSQTPEAEYPVAKLTEQGWAGIGLKDLTSNWPQVAYYNPTYPLATLDFWPVPTSTTMEGVLYWPQGLSQFAALTTTYNLPPGYARMIVKALGVELSPSYGKKPDPLLMEQARDAKEVVKRNNKRLIDLSFEPGSLISRAGRSYYNIYRS